MVGGPQATFHEATEQGYNRGRMDLLSRRLSRFLMLMLLASAICVTQLRAAQAVSVDLSSYRPGPVRIAEEEERGELVAEWRDEADDAWRAVFSLDPEKPLVRGVSVEGKPVLRNARPFYQAETGKRRRGWNAFFDFPPSHPEGTRHATGRLQLSGAAVRTVGNRVELSFDGMRLGVFTGTIVYTIFPGSRLVQQTARLTTAEPDTAYYYDAGLEFAAPDDTTPGRNMRTPFAYYDTEGELREPIANGLEPERVPYRVRYRTLATKAGVGSVAVFPAPHQYFFPRDFTSNLAYLWHRFPAGTSFARHPPDSGYELGFLSLGQRTAGYDTADERLLLALKRDTARGVGRGTGIHEPGPLSPTRRIPDCEQPLASCVHGAGLGERL